MRTLTKSISAFAATAMALSLAACGGGSSNSQASGSTDSKANDSAQCQNKVKKSGVEKVTVWAWYPAIEKIVDSFNESHDDVQVCWTNAGQGSPEYTKLQNAIKAKSGAPDIVQLEYEAMPQFVAGAEQHLVDLSKYGMNKYKSDYTEGAWNSVSIGTDKSVYGVPVDLGPFVMYVRQDVFDKYGVKVPTTWDEFAEAGRQLKAKGYDKYYTDFALNGTGVNSALYAQKNEAVYKYSAANPDKVKIDMNTQGVKDVLDYWKGLVKEGLADTTDASTTDWNTSLMKGNYAVYVQASWLTGYIKGLDTKGATNFKVYKAPVWDDTTPMVNQGGSAWAVTDQVKDAPVAAKVARELFSSDEAQKIGVTDGGLFPAWTKMLDSDYFKDMKDSFLGNQQANEEVTIPVANGYKGYEFLPFQTYAYDEQTKALKKIMKEDADTSSTVKALNDELNAYAKQQGFTTE